MHVYHKKGYFYCPKKKKLIPKICWFVQKPFSNPHVNVHRVKNVLLNIVWLLVSMLNSSFFE
ncbi:hypothetical protein AB205_0085900 [Aquarana catesbeiana]|uniref:Uncharacterized protein n=1 Tax=Aquarana catesbeiana TaxID=8400 RepID=A0A2G9RE95_AQUCT|nr:hypothetical protein AB205_0085900 [Aquarana catesbeiana]